MDTTYDISIQGIDLTTEAAVIENEYDPIYREIEWWMTIVSYAILIPIGSVGNILSFVVMQRGSLQNVSTCFYMRILAISDTGKYHESLTHSPNLNEVKWNLSLVCWLSWPHSPDHIINVHVPPQQLLDKVVDAMYTPKHKIISDGKVRIHGNPLHINLGLGLFYVQLVQ